MKKECNGKKIKNKKLQDIIKTEGKEMFRSNVEKQLRATELVKNGRFGVEIENKQKQNEDEQQPASKQQNDDQFTPRRIVKIHDRRLVKDNKVCISNSFDPLSDEEDCDDKSCKLSSDDGTKNDKDVMKKGKTGPKDKVVIIKEHLIISEQELEIGRAILTLQVGQMEEDGL